MTASRVSFFSHVINSVDNEFFGTVDFQELMKDGNRNFSQPAPANWSDQSIRKN
jgi:hypothetical protein